MQKFSYEYYKHMLKMAIEEGYFLSSFERYDKSNKKTVIIRHDVDYTLNGVYQLADIEKSLNVTATYMFRVHAHEYNLCAPHVMSMINYLKSHGHGIGLHYETTAIAIALKVDPRKILENDITLLGQIIESTVRSGSEHRDISHVIHEAPYYHELHDPRDYFEFWAMAPEYCREMKYLSDSNGVWREGDLTQHIGRYDRFQILVHPDWWFDSNLLLKGPYYHGRGN